MSAATKAEGQILRLYTGRKRDCRINGPAEPTAYVRTVSEGPLWLARTGLSGNQLGTARRLGTENHAVYLMPEAHYRYFEDVLGRSIPPGSFAENISYAGPDENTLRIGDRIRIGAALVELTSPRIPCYKMAHFVGTDPGFPSRFSASGRTGVYARVVEPGLVGAGDDLVVVRSSSKNATMAELNAVLTAGKPRADVISRVRASPSLLPDVRQVIDDRLATLCLDDAAEPHRVGIAARRQETPDVVSLWFDLPLAPDQAPKPGQFVTFGVEDAQGNTHFRCYSLSDGPFRRGDGRSCRISVKREVAGHGAFSVSNWLHDHVRAGDECLVFQPGGDFFLPDEPAGPLAFIAGGIGITPILPQIRALADAKYPSPVKMIYVVRTCRDLALLNELVNAAADLPRFELRVFATREEGAATSPPPFIEPGRPHLESWIADLDDTTQLFVCGPVPMIDAARAAHASLGRPNSRLHFERFSEPGEGEYTGEPAPGARIAVAPYGPAGTWNPEDGSLLEWVETHTDYRPPAACRSGICRTCKATLLRGTVVYPSSVAPPSQTEVLLCCARPQSDIEIEMAERYLSKMTG